MAIRTQKQRLRQFGSAIDAVLLAITSQPIAAVTGLLHGPRHVPHSKYPMSKAVEDRLMALSIASRRIVAC